MTIQRVALNIYQKNKMGKHFADIIVKFSKSAPFPSHLLSSPDRLETYKRKTLKNFTQ